MKTNDFMELQAHWYAVLKETGFTDIEKTNEVLKTYDRRTIAFENREKIRDFFMKLDQFLTEHPDLPPLHTHILQLYSEGKYIKNIAAAVSRTRRTVHEIILKYKQRILTG